MTAPEISSAAAFLAKADASGPFRRLREGAFAWRAVVLAIFAAWVVWVGWAHEPWTDEAQAWLLARDSTLTELFFTRLHFEGSPGLWHLILWVLIRLHLPYSAFFAIPASFAIAGAGVVLWRAPFPAWMRLAILGSYFFGYQYGVVARSYSVDLLLVPLAASWFASRAKRPLRYALVLGLIANLNAFGCIGSAILGLELLIVLFPHVKAGDRGALGALGLLLLAGLFAAGTAYPSPDVAFLEYDHGTASERTMQMLADALVDRLATLSSAAPGKAEGLVGFALSLGAFLASAFALRRSRSGLFGLAILVAFLLFAGTIHARPWHSGMFYLYWVLALWIAFEGVGRSDRRIICATFAFVALVQVPETLLSGLRERTMTYAPGHEAARLVTAYRKAHPDAQIAIMGCASFALQPWLEGNPFANYHGGKAHPAYLTWSAKDDYRPLDPARTWRELKVSRPPAIVSDLTMMQGRDLPRLRKTACAAGYTPTKLMLGTMIWRGYDYGDESIVLLERKPCD